MMSTSSPSSSHREFISSTQLRAPLSRALDILSAIPVRECHTISIFFLRLSTLQKARAACQYLPVNIAPQFYTTTVRQLNLFTALFQQTRGSSRNYILHTSEMVYTTVSKYCKCIRNVYFVPDQQQSASSLESTVAGFFRELRRTPENAAARRCYSVDWYRYRYVCCFSTLCSCLRLEQRVQCRGEINPGIDEWEETGHFLFHVRYDCFHTVDTDEGYIVHT